MPHLPYRRSDEIVAYTYQADIYCPVCVIETMIGQGITPSPLACNRCGRTTYWCNCGRRAR